MNSQNDKIPELAKVVERNVNTLLSRKKEENSKRGFEERLVDGVTAFISSMPPVYVHLVVFGSWILWNRGILKVKPFDPSFIILATRCGSRGNFSYHICIDRSKTNKQPG